MWKYVLILVSVYLLGWLPLRVLYGLANLSGELAYIIFVRVRHRVWDNMRHVMGPATPKAELRRAARQVFRNTARYYVDLISRPRLDVQRLYERNLVHYGLEENLLAPLKQGKGVVLASGHFGNAELVVQGLLPLGVKALALTEPLEPPALSRLVHRLRSSAGQTFLPVSLSNVKATLRYLKAGGMVAIMCDRDIEGRSLRVPFCGAPASMPVGAVELAMRTGAALVPTFAHRRDDNHYEVFAEPPLELARTGNPQADLETNVRRLLERFEPHLRRDPGQWTVLEAVWEDGKTEQP
jgi:KDO2-lipid IV(A) lauroyltransferase